MDSTLAGTLSVLISAHPLKAHIPIFVTLSGIMIPLNAAHPSKALSPMVLMPSGNTTSFRLVQKEKA